MQQTIHQSSTGAFNGSLGTAKAARLCRPFHQASQEISLMLRQAPSLVSEGMSACYVTFKAHEAIKCFKALKAMVDLGENIECSQLSSVSAIIQKLVANKAPLYQFPIFDGELARDKSKPVSYDTCLIRTNWLWRLR